MEELFKSLSESVSEECFDDIMGIVETLLGAYQEKGAPAQGHKEYMANALAPIIRGRRKQLEKKNKENVKTYKEIRKQIPQAEEAKNKARAEYDKAVAKDEQALKDYKEAKDGTMLKDKLRDAWLKTSSKRLKASAKDDKEFYNLQNLRTKQSNTVDSISTNDKKRNSLNKTLAKSKDRHNYTYKYAIDKIARK